MESLAYEIENYMGGFVLTDNEGEIDRVEIFESEGKIFMRDLELDEEFDGIENVLTELTNFKTLEEVLDGGIEKGFWTVEGYSVFFNWETEGEMFDWLRGEDGDF